MRVGQEEREFLPLADRIADRIAHRAFRRVARLLRIEPRLELVHDGPALGVTHLEVLWRAEQVGVERCTLDRVDAQDEVYGAFGGLRGGALCVEELPPHVREAACPFPLARHRDAVVAHVGVGHELAGRASQHVLGRLTGAAL
jgi:hypothetical protein